MAAVLIRGICSNPVRAAYISSLESQISSLRDELATVYKTQGQNAQRLLAMNETLREKEEISRVDADALRKSRDEIAVLRKKVDQHNELMAEKDRTAQVSPAVDATPDTLLTLLADPSRRDLDPPTGTESDRGAQPDSIKRQCEALTALAGREAGRGEPNERGQSVLRGHEVAASNVGGEQGGVGDKHVGVGKRGGAEGGGSNDDDGWDAISGGDGPQSDAEWLMVEDD